MDSFSPVCVYLLRSTIAAFCVCALPVTKPLTNETQRRNEVFMASYVSPEIREKFETLSTDLKNCILDRNVRLNNIHDLIRVLEEIVEEGEAG